MNLGLVITEKHTKLRGLLVLKQKKGKRGERRRANSNGGEKGVAERAFIREGERFRKF